jgi:hypothetical protein
MACAVSHVAAAPPPASAVAGSRRIGRELLAVVALKILALILIYALFFSPSHRPPHDVVAHVINPSSPYHQTR